MTRLTRLLTASVLALALVACGGEADPDAGAAPDDTGGDDAMDDPETDDPAVDDPNGGEPDDAAGDPDEGATDDAEVGVDEGIGNGRDDGPADTGDLHEEIAQARALLGSDDAEVLVADRVNWPDGSLGCPEPGMMYTMALVDGYRIVLDDGGTQVAFHGQDGQEPFRCDAPADPLDGGGALDR